MKKLYFNFIFLVALLLLVQAGLATVLLADFNGREKIQFAEVAMSKISAARQQSQRVIEEDIEALSSLDYNADVPFSYYAFAQYGGGDTLTVKTQSGSFDYTLTPFGKESLLDKAYSSMSSASFFVSAPSFEYIYYSRDNSEGKLLLLREATSVINPSFLYDFENVLILSPDGAVISDYKDTHRHSTLNSFADPSRIIGFDRGYSYYGGNLIVFENLESLTGYKIAALYNAESINAYLQKNIIRLAVILVILIALNLLFIFLFVKSYIRRYNELTCVRELKSVYVIYVDRAGRIKRSNSNFSSEFDTFEVFDKICETGVKATKIIEDSLPMTVLLTDKEGKERFITFLNAKTVGGYKLIGEEVTPLMRQFYDNLKLLSRDENLGIYNRKQFIYDYEKAHEEFRTDGGAFVLFELKNTKNYNTMFGSDFYVKIKKTFASMLTEMFEKFGKVYYLDNEKFALLITGSLTTEKFLDEIAHNMKELNLPAAIDNNLIKVECLAGIVVVDKSIRQKTIDEIISYAALSVDKSQDLKRLFTVYEISKSDYVLSQSKKREIVKYIMENNQVEVYYQPQYNVITKKISGFEALCRIKGKYERELKISEFIEVAEQSGYMILLGEIIFEKAFAFAKEAEIFNVSVALNVSPVQLLQAGFVKNFLDRFAKYNLRRGSVSLEITETFLMTSFEEVVEKLEILSANGINIHLDDFGVAYSSMLYLKKLPINTIKIDKEFVADITNNKFSRVICSKIIDITKELELDSIAEGVETQQQLQSLKELGCKIIQGFLIGEALPPERAKTLLTDFNIRGIKNV